MSTLILFLGALLIAIGILMHGNRAGWFLFVVTPRSVLWIALAIVLGIFMLSHAKADPNHGVLAAHVTATECEGHIGMSVHEYDRWCARRFLRPKSYQPKLGMCFHSLFPADGHTEWFYGKADTQGYCMEPYKFLREISLH
jgi:hypothetical protein